MKNLDLLTFCLKLNILGKNLHLILKSKFPEKLEGKVNYSDDMWLEEINNKLYCLICDKFVTNAKITYNNIGCKIIEPDIDNLMPISEHALNHLKEFNLISFL